MVGFAESVECNKNSSLFICPGGIHCRSVVSHMTLKLKDRARTTQRLTQESAMELGLLVGQVGQVGVGVMTIKTQQQWVTRHVNKK